MAPAQGWHAYSWSVPYFFVFHIYIIILLEYWWPRRSCIDDKPHLGQLALGFSKFMPAFHWDGHLILLCSQGDPWPDKHEACIQHATPVKGKHHILKGREFTPSPRMHIGPMLIFSVSFQFSHYVNATQKKSYVSNMQLQWKANITS